MKKNIAIGGLFFLLILISFFLVAAKTTNADLEEKLEKAEDANELEFDRGARARERELVEQYSQYLRLFDDESILDPKTVDEAVTAIMEPYTYITTNIMSDPPISKYEFGIRTVMAERGDGSPVKLRFSVTAYGFRKSVTEFNERVPDADTTLLLPDSYISEIRKTVSNSTGVDIGAQVKAILSYVPAYKLNEELKRSGDPPGMQIVESLSFDNIEVVVD